MEFQEFPKIPRLNREVTITEKLDGTNACVYVSDDGQTIGAQSRNRIIVPGADNYGFAGWVYQNEITLKEILGPGYHYGEWWGRGIGRNYGKTDRTFSLFNCERWKGLRDYDVAKAINLSVVPELASCNISHVPEVVRQLGVSGSVAAPGFMNPEGVIVYHTAARQYFKVLLENDEIPKSKV